MFSHLSPVPALPSNPGPLNVGSAIFEVPVASIPSSSAVPDPSITTIRFRIYYPTTREATSKECIYWLPNPQHEWVKAYASFMGASDRVSNLIATVPSFIKYTTIPAVSQAPILPRPYPYPTVIFSHGLGGNNNSYSAILCGLASCGVVGVAPEHRDGSAPMSIVASENGDTTTVKQVEYQQVSHSPSPEVLDTRNRQLRVRLWELELLYTAIQRLNAGETLKSLSPKAESAPMPSFKSALNLAPSAVTWAGHSFGAATVAQFLKSVFWHQSLPTPAGDGSLGAPQPLYTPASVQSELFRQITPSSPLVLLDPWMMPFDGEQTRWLWEKPLPSYCADTSSDESEARSNVIAILSEGFYDWKSNLARLEALLSPDPATHNGSRANNPLVQRDASRPRLFYAPKSAHLSQSDFGILFPIWSKFLLKAEEPERTMKLNIRAILQIMRKAGLEVDNFASDNKANDNILDANEEGWVRIGVEG